MIVALLFHVPNCLHTGLGELWVRSGRGTTTHVVPLHILHIRLGYDDESGSQGLTTIRLHWFRTTTTLTSATIQRAEQYLVNCVDVGSKSSSFQELREHQFHFSKSISHQTLPPTSQCLEPHRYRAFYNAYITMHVLDAQLNVNTGDLDLMD